MDGAFSFESSGSLDKSSLGFGPDRLAVELLVGKDDGLRSGGLLALVLQSWEVIMTALIKLDESAKGTLDGAIGGASSSGVVSSTFSQSEPPAVSNTPSRPLTSCAQSISSAWYIDS